jgi:hypothetical protein
MPWIFDRQTAARNEKVPGGSFAVLVTAQGRRFACREDGRIHSAQAGS